jgi:hypothetical protein
VSEGVGPSHLRIPSNPVGRLRVNDDYTRGSPRCYGLGFSRAAAPPASERSQRSQGLAKVVTLGDLLDAAFESNGVLELHGELRCGDRIWTRP